MKPVLHGIGTSEHPNLRTFDPEDRRNVAMILQIDVGPRGAKGTDLFTVRLATPAGLAGLPVSDDGTIAAGKMLVIARYDYSLVWGWVERIVARCEADSWDGCVARLRDRLEWEFDDYQEGRAH
jgi:hypothetical protein